MAKGIKVKQGKFQGVLSALLKARPTRLLHLRKSGLSRDVSAKVNFDYERLPDETDDHYEFRGLLRKWERCNLWAHIEATPWMMREIRGSELVWRMQQIMVRNPGYVAEFHDALAGFEGIFPALAFVPPSKS